MIFYVRDYSWQGFVSQVRVKRRGRLANHLTGHDKIECVILVKCSTIWLIATQYSTLQCNTTKCSSMQCSAVHFNSVRCSAHPVLRVTVAYDKEGHTRWLQSSPRGSSSAPKCTAVDAEAEEEDEAVAEAKAVDAGTVGGVMLDDSNPPGELSLRHFFFTFTLLRSLWLRVLLLLRVRTRMSTSSRTFFNALLLSKLTILSVQSATVTLMSMCLFSVQICYKCRKGYRWIKMRGMYILTVISQRSLRRCSVESQRSYIALPGRAQMFVVLWAVHA